MDAATVRLLGQPEGRRLLAEAEAEWSGRVSPLALAARLRHEHAADLIAPR